MLTRRTRHPTEEQLQMYSNDVFETFRAPGVVGFHVPNERKGSVQHYVNLKRLGVRKGAPDWVFFLPGKRYACVELKKHNAVQTKEQKEFQRDVEAIGGTYVVARTMDEIDDAFRSIGAIRKPALRLAA